MTLAAAAVMSDLLKSKNTWNARCTSGALAAGAGGGVTTAGSGAGAGCGRAELDANRQEQVVRVDKRNA